MVNLGVLLMLATALSVQLGGAVAATLIPQVGPMGTVALRITIA
ncbi:MAG: EamA family transporter, partial [Cutibacterium granulosum]|nr:EamA family transporter [Cutibacterium granulosum]